MQFNWKDWVGSMSTQFNNLQDLFIHELRDVYSAENQILKALPKMASAASSSELKSAFQQHEQETRGQVQRLERIFQMFNVSASGVTCEGMEGLVSEGQELISSGADPHVRDAGLVAAAQKVEHYEMAAYGSLRTWAQQLGKQEAARLLQATLDEEKATDQKLNRIAESMVNLQAAHA